MLVQLFEHSTSSYVRAGPRVVLQVLPMTMTLPGVRGGAPSRADLTRGVPGTWGAGPRRETGVRDTTRAGGAPRSGAARGRLCARR
jgi:hypothetical protein